MPAKGFTIPNIEDQSVEGLIRGITSTNPGSTSMITYFIFTKCDFSDADVDKLRAILNLAPNLTSLSFKECSFTQLTNQRLMNVITENAPHLTKLEFNSEIFKSPEALKCFDFRLLANLPALKNLDILSLTDQSTFNTVEMCEAVREQLASYVKQSQLTELTVAGLRPAQFARFLQGISANTTLESIYTVPADITTDGEPIPFDVEQVMEEGDDWNAEPPDHMIYQPYIKEMIHYLNAHPNLTGIYMGYKDAAENLIRTRMFTQEMLSNPQQAEQAQQEKLTEAFLSGRKSNSENDNEAAANAFALLCGERGLGTQKFDFSPSKEDQCFLDIAAHIKNLNAQISRLQSSANAHSELFRHKRERSSTPDLTETKAAKTETNKSPPKKP